MPHDKINLYPHFAVDHFPEFTIRHGALVRYSMQGEEHAHSLRKRDRKTRSNHKWAGCAGRRDKDGNKTVVEHGAGTHEAQLRLDAIRMHVNLALPQRQSAWRRAREAHLKAQIAAQHEREVADAVEDAHPRAQPAPQLPVV